MSESHFRKLRRNWSARKASREGTSGSGVDEGVRAVKEVVDTVVEEFEAVFPEFERVGEIAYADGEGNRIRFHVQVAPMQVGEKIQIGCDTTRHRRTRSGPALQIPRTELDIYRIRRFVEQKLTRFIKTLSAPNLLCPVQGNRVDPDIPVTYEGITVHLCCERCREAFRKAPRLYLRYLLEDGDLDAGTRESVAAVLDPST